MDEVDRRTLDHVRGVVFVGAAAVGELGKFVRKSSIITTRGESRSVKDDDGIFV